MKQNRTLSALAVFVSAVLWGTYGSFVTVISAGEWEEISCRRSASA